MDVHLFSTPDGGEITIADGDLVRDDGYETAVMLSLFGGNEDDSGAQGDARRQWWGNLGEPNPARRYRSETQNLLRAIPLSSGNLKRIDAAVKRDLEWMLDGYARTIATRVTMPALNTVFIEIAIEADGRVRTLSIEFQGQQMKLSSAA